VLQQFADEGLEFIDLSLVLALLSFELGRELVDLFLLLVKNFVFLLVVRSLAALLQVSIDLSDVLLVGVHHSFHFEGFLVQLLQLGVVLLNSALESLSLLGQRQVSFVGLQLQVFLLLGQRGLLVLEMLGPLLKSV